MGKIFCKNCKHFKIFIGVLGSYNESCKRPDRKDSHSGLSTAREPRSINKNNKCKWFKTGRMEYVNLI